MSKLHEGYLGLFFEGTSPSVAIPCITLISICLICQMAIGFIAVRQIESHKNIPTQIKVPFGACFVFAIASTIVLIPWSPIFSSSWNTNTHVILYCFLFFCLFSFWTCLLLILVLRLWVVFSEFMQMSNRMNIGFKCIFTVLFLITLFVFIVILMGADIDYSTDTLFVDTHSDEEIIIIYVLAFSFIFLYLIGAVCATLFFLNNLRKLALSRTSSSRNLEAQQTEDIPLNDQQERIINLASRYALLFIIAMTSDIVVMVLLNFAVSLESGIRNVFFAMDCTVNLFCVYLQFAFAGEHYMRCCGCIHRRWRKRVDKIARRAIHKHSFELPASNSSCSVATSPNPTLYVSFSDTFFESRIQSGTCTQVKSGKINTPIKCIAK